MNKRDLTRKMIVPKVIEAITEVHTQLGPGLWQSTYEHCLVYELKQRGLEVKQHIVLPLIYKDVKLGAGYRIDLLVEDNVVIVVKTVESLSYTDMAQLLTCMRLKGLKFGVLVNFNSEQLQYEVKAIDMNNQQSPYSGNWW